MYENKRNGKLFEQVGEVNEKTKTVMMRDIETGKTSPVTTATIKRWYKKIEEAAPVVEDVPAVVEEKKAEPVAVVEEVKKEAKPRKKKEMTGDAVALHNYVIETCEKLGGTVFVPAKEMKFRIFKVGKSGFVKYSWSSKAVILQVKSKALGLEEPKNPCNHCYDDKYKFMEDTEENRAEIYRIMETCYKWQEAKNKAKEENKAKKVEKKTKKDSKQVA